MLSRSQAVDRYIYDACPASVEYVSSASGPAVMPVAGLGSVVVSTPENNGGGA